MNKKYLTLTIITVFFLFSSCKEDSFEILAPNVKVISNAEIRELDFIKKYLIEGADKQTILKKRSFAYSQSQNPNSALYKYRDIYAQMEDDKDKKREIEREIEKQKRQKINFKGVNSKIEIKNNTKEIIENSILTVIFNFNFNNKQFNYLKSYNLLNNETWKSNETLKININDITTIAIGNNKLLAIHTPKSVKAEYYITAKNSVGYSNLEKNSKGLRQSNYFNNRELNYGKLTDKELTQNEIKGLGEKIYQQDITLDWNDVKNQNNKKINIKNINHLSTQPSDFVNTQIYIIQNEIEIAVSNDFELRDENSDVGKTMNSFRNGYNKTNSNKIGKSDLVFQPTGTNINKPDAVSDVTRMTIAFFNIDDDKFPKWNKDLSSQKSNEINDLFKNITIKSLKEMPFFTKLITWNEIDPGNINNQTFFKISYIYEINNKNAYSESYQFFNTNQKVIISLTTDYPCKDKWKKIFDESLETFKFKNKK